MTGTPHSERRRNQRYTAELDIEWVGSESRGSGSLGDISESGCLVLSDGKLKEGDPVKLIFPIDGGTSAEFEGDVAGFTEDVGFAVRFRHISPAQRDLIAKIIRDSAD
jgi:hypothetical protein